jgi:hypothetical protein
MRLFLEEKDTWRECFRDTSALVSLQAAGGGEASDILGEIVPMRWLMTGLLVSLGALLFAAAGLAYHVWSQRRSLRRQPSPEAGKVQRNDQEPEA